MIDLSPPVISGIEGAYDPDVQPNQIKNHRWFETLTRADGFHKYFWDDKEGFVKNSKQLALLHYLVVDYDEIDKFNQAPTEDGIFNKNASSLLNMISGVASNEYAHFRTHQKNFIPVLKDAIGSVLSYVSSESKPIENFE